MREELNIGDTVIANRDVAGIRKGTVCEITKVSCSDSELYFDVKCGDIERKASSENSWDKTLPTLDVEVMEKLAVSHEAFGFGRIDHRGLTTHGFDPEGLFNLINAVRHQAYLDTMSLLKLK